MYIDTGYFGNDKTKQWHRVAYNNLQTLDHVPIIDVEQRLLDNLKEKDARYWLRDRFE